MVKKYYISFLFFFLFLFFPRENWKKNHQACDIERNGCWLKNDKEKNESRKKKEGEKKERKKERKGERFKDIWNLLFCRLNWEIDKVSKSGTKNNLVRYARSLALMRAYTRSLALSNASFAMKLKINDEIDVCHEQALYTFYFLFTSTRAQESSEQYQKKAG